jgi:hypothetical protein
MEIWQKRFRELSPFQIVVLVWLVVISLVAGGLLFGLLRTQAAARTLLNQAADGLIALADSHIRYTVRVDHVMTVETEIPVDQEIVVPVEMEIDQVFPVDTTILFKEEFVVPIDEVLSIDQTFNVPFEVPLTGRTVAVPIPIQADIPIRFDVAIPIDNEVDLHADIPVQLPISGEFTVAISRTVPVEAEVPIVLDIPIEIVLSDTSFGEHLHGLAESLRR